MPTRGCGSAVGDESFKQLVLGRIVEQTSKADSLRVLEDVDVGRASLGTLFRSLLNSFPAGRPIGGTLTLR